MAQVSKYGEKINSIKIDCYLGTLILTWKYLSKA
jgi:hypothetical protein